MAEPDAPGATTGKPLIESDRVEGMAVDDAPVIASAPSSGLMIEKKTGQVVHGLVLRWSGLGSEEHIIPLE